MAAIKIVKGTNNSFIIGEVEYPAGAYLIQYGTKKISIFIPGMEVPIREFNWAQATNNADAPFANLAAFKTYFSNIAFTLAGAGSVAAANIVGLIPIANIPTGATGTTVALGNHTQAATTVNVAADVTNGIAAGTLQVVLSALAVRVKALEDAP